MKGAAHRTAGDASQAGRRGASDALSPDRAGLPPVLEQMDAGRAATARETPSTVGRLRLAIDPLSVQTPVRTGPAVERIVTGAAV
jgi:hypothetical protein